MLDRQFQIWLIGQLEKATTATERHFIMEWVMDSYSKARDEWAAGRDYV